jgi:beta-glucanase (GH16 family)
MKAILVLLTLAAALVDCAVSLAEDELAEEWRLVWSDEFEGEEIDRSHWDFDLGNGFFNYDANTWISGWGNGELQYYTKEPENAFVTGGSLHLRAVKESLHGCGYSSARLKTRKRDGSPLFNKAYGRFEVRAKLPSGRGIWPAIWMLPQDDKYGTWAASGEIDLVEAKGHEPEKVLGTLHYGSRWPANAHSSREYKFPAGGIGEFHVYALEWEPGAIRWYVDDSHYATQTFWWSSSKLAGDRGAQPAGESDLNPWPAPFDQPFYLILNVAVGGQFPGAPDKTTTFPCEMLVDYIRVYDKAQGYGPVPTRGEGKLPFGR